MSNRSEHEIRESIESTRVRMSDTIEQIGDRVNPDRVKADLKAKAREQVHEVKNNMKRKARNTMRDVEHGVTDAGRGLWATIRENPVPAGMITVGLAWLIANRRGGEQPRYGYTDTGTYSTGPSAPNSTQWSGDGSASETHGIREKAADVMHNASDRIGEAQERVSELTHRAQERVGNLSHQAQARVGNLAHETRNRAERAERRVEEALHQNPMAAGAMALAMGVAAGLLIPETEREHQMLGPTRDRALERAQQAAGRMGEKVHDSMRDAAGESAKRAVDEVWTRAGHEEHESSPSEPRR